MVKRGSGDEESYRKFPDRSTVLIQLITVNRLRHDRGPVQFHIKSITFMVQNIRYLNGRPSHMTIPFDYRTPEVSGIESSIWMYGIQMYVTTKSFFVQNCPLIFSFTNTEIVAVYILNKTFPYFHEAFSQKSSFLIS